MKIKNNIDNIQIQGNINCKGLSPTFLVNFKIIKDEGELINFIFKKRDIEIISFMEYTINSQLYILFIKNVSNMMHFYAIEKNMLLLLKNNNKITQDFEYNLYIKQILGII